MKDLRRKLGNGSSMAANVKRCMVELVGVVESGQNRVWFTGHQVTYVLVLGFLQTPEVARQYIYMRKKHND